MPAVEWFLFVLIGAAWIGGWILLPRVPYVSSVDSPLPDGVPPLSVVIPARDESLNLPRLISSLKMQKTPPEEIIVVDDESSDDTAELARSLGARVLSSKTLPPGWTGKTWALRQGAQEARYDSLLLLDADTWFEPGALDVLRHKFLSLPPKSVLSVLPFHVTEKTYEGASLFFNILVAAGAGGFGLFGAPRLFGQSLMIDRLAFLNAGAKDGVRKKVLENFAMSEELVRDGYSLCCFGGKGLLSFRMFPEGVRGLIEGWTKAFAQGAAGTSGKVLTISILWMLGLGFSFILPLLTLVDGGPAWSWQTFGVIYSLFFCQVALFAWRLGSFPLWSYALFPLSFVFYQTLFFKSLWMTLRKTPARWRGRTVL